MLPHKYDFLILDVAENHPLTKGTLILSCLMEDVSLVMIFLLIRSG